MVTIDYVSKWIEVVVASNIDAKTIIKFFKKNIFSHFGVPEYSSMTEVHIFVMPNCRRFRGIIMSDIRWLHLIILRKTAKQRFLTKS